MSTLLTPSLCLGTVIRISTLRTVMSVPFDEGYKSLLLRSS